MNIHLKFQSPFAMLNAIALAAAAFASPIPARAQSAVQSSAKPAATTPATGAQLQFNFQDVPLQTVLDYLSRAAGFIIVRKVDVPGNVSILSQQGISADEAADLLDSALHDRGFAALRNGRTLTIVTLEDARKRPQDVTVGSDPAAMPEGDQMVTQIIPVINVDAPQLVKDIAGLIPEWATIAASADSNAVVLTATKGDVKRVAEIIRALDRSSRESKGEIRVYKLEFADAKDAATLVGQLFAKAETNDAVVAPGMMIDLNAAAGQLIGAPAAGNPDATLRRSVPNVIATSDDRTNSLVVSAPKESFTTIEALIKQIDRAANIKNEVRIFQLKHADATVMAQSVLGIFGPPEQGGNGTGAGAQPWFGGTAADGSQVSARQMANAVVQVVADSRTDSIVVSAPAPTMERIAETVAKLDQNPAKNKRVHVFKLNGGNGAQVAATLQQMFGQNARKAGAANANSGSQRTAVPGSAFGGGSGAPTYGAGEQ